MCVEGDHRGSYEFDIPVGVGVIVAPASGMTQYRDPVFRPLVSVCP